MKFCLILMVLGWCFVWLVGCDEGFCKQFVYCDVVMQWCIFNGGVVCWYYFQLDWVISCWGLYVMLFVILNFKDVDYVFCIFKVFGKNQMVFMEGMQVGDIKVEGDFGYLMWFMILMKFIFFKC